MHHNDEAGWNWFEPSKNREQEGENSAELATKFARCFQGEEGDAVLTHLAQMTLARPLGANAHNGILRHLEGQRYLVSYILGMVRQGRTG